MLFLKEIGRQLVHRGSSVKNLCHAMELKDAYYLEEKL